MRICGALKEQPVLTARQCWCGGIFCGRGGVLKTHEWRRDFRSQSALVSRGEAEMVMRQADLYDGDLLRDKWRKRFDAAAGVASSHGG